MKWYITAIRVMKYWVILVHIDILLILILVIVSVFGE